ncbi:hypothetical protein KUTeg_002942 [Tegillarca granosa]|uniref:Fanconi anemia core complex-associated protein 24 pseudonuclease domain-containing protein n=1 Tax=Tegillarca granosa TaxID=220873 RepID=A0ABQ9FMA1_TEGGR|nr:hypothetical protein KUTeg_002942 [Tegillarca granosa]
MRAVELSKNFLRVCKNDAPSIAEKISSAYKEKIERNRSALISIIKTIILCGKQNIALRGKTDDSTINSFDCVISVFICHNTLKYLSPISDGLQNPECDLVRAADQAHALVTFLSSKREDVSFYAKVWHEATSLADANEITVDKPRTAARQIHRTNVHAETAKEYWRLNTQLQERLCDSRPRLKAQYLLSHKINLLTNDMWQDIKECYSDFLPHRDNIDDELEFVLWGLTVGGTQILYEDNLGMIDFYPSDHLGVVYISEADLVTGTGYRKKLAKLRKANTVPIQVIAERTTTSCQYYFSLQKFCMMELGFILVPVPSQVEAGSLLAQMVSSEGRQESNPFSKKRNPPSYDQALLNTVQCIPKLGDIKAKLLLEKFSSLNGIHKASKDELAAVVGKASAQHIKNFLGQMS